MNPVGRVSDTRAQSVVEGVGHLLELAAFDLVAARHGVNSGKRQAHLGGLLAPPVPPPPRLSLRVVPRVVIDCCPVPGLGMADATASRIWFNQSVNLDRPVSLGGSFGMLMLLRRKEKQTTNQPTTILESVVISGCLTRSK